MAANTHPKTGIAYGVLSGNNVPELLDDIMTNGTDETFEAGREEIKGQLKTALEGVFEEHSPIPKEDAFPTEDAYFEAQKKVLTAITEAISGAIKDTHYNHKKIAENADEHELFEAMQTDGSAEKIDYDALLSSLEDAGLWENSDDGDGHNYSHQWEDEKTKEQIKVQVTYLGGAPLIYVLESPYTANCAWCSPCCPNAGDLDTPREHGITAYCLPEDDMPDDWDGTVELLDAETLKKHKDENGNPD